MTDCQPLTKDQAMALYESGFWRDMTPRQIAEFQMSQELLCVPFDVFHKAIEETLGRSVWTHEFGSLGIVGLRAELFDGKPAPSLTDIINLIPEEKRIIVEVGS